MRASPNRNAFASTDDYILFSFGAIIIGLGFGGFQLWHFHHGEICAVAMRIAHWEMRFIASFADRFELADIQVQRANPQNVTFRQIEGLWRDIGMFFRIPAAIFVAALGVLCFLRAAPSRFCRDLDLEALIREQARGFGCVAAFVGRRLKLVSPATRGAPRPADPALNAAEWVACWATNVAGAFDEAKARIELRRQLGPIWCSAELAPAHIRCMLAVFALHGAQKRQESQDLLGALAASLAARPDEDRFGPAAPLTFPRALVERADHWIADPEVGGPMLALAGLHGFTTPFLMTVLTEARLRAGVLAPGQFAWLKLVDRRLWYALHSLGFPFDGCGSYPHPNPRVEAVGARDHWAAECIVGDRILIPSLDRAVAAIRASRGDAGCETKTKEVR
jgi:intracellular multiplication protein IcmP